MFNRNNFVVINLICWLSLYGTSFLAHGESLAFERNFQSSHQEIDNLSDVDFLLQQEHIKLQEEIIDSQNKTLVQLQEKIKGLESRDTKSTESSEQQQNFNDPAAQLTHICLSNIEDTFDEELLNEIMKTVPEKLRAITASIALRKDVNDLYCGGIIPHHILLVGPPGVGKTTFAKAIGCTCNLAYTFIKASVLANEYINSGPTNLYRIFTPILNSTQPQLVIIDELQTIMKNNKQVNEAIAEALWMIIDECRTKNNILIIATANDIDSLPLQLQSRFSKSIYHIELPTQERREAVLRYYFNKLGSNLYISVSDSFIKNWAGKTKGFSIRELEHLVELTLLDLCFNVSRNQNFESGANVHKHVTTAYGEIMKNKKSSSYMPEWCKNWSSEFIVGTFVMPLIMAGVHTGISFWMQSYFDNKRMIIQPMLPVNLQTIEKRS